MLAAFRFAAVSAVMVIDSAVVHQHRMVQIFPSHALVTHCCSRPTTHPPTRLIRHCRCPSMISSPSPTPSKKVVLCCELLNLWKKKKNKEEKHLTGALSLLGRTTLRSRYHTLHNLSANWMLSFFFFLLGGDLIAWLPIQGQDEHISPTLRVRSEPRHSVILQDI